MKRTLKVALLIMSLVLSFTLGCGDDDDDNKVVNPGGSTTTTNSIKANVTGKYTQSLSSPAPGVVKELTTNTVAIMGIFPVANVTFNITIHLNVDQGVGTYQLTNPEDVTGVNDGHVIFTHVADSVVEGFNSTTGTVKITDISTRIIGTFQFTAENYDGEQVTVSSGSFNANYNTTE